MKHINTPDTTCFASQRSYGIKKGLSFFFLKEKHNVLTGLARAKLSRHPSTNAIFSMVSVFVAVGWLTEDQVPKHTFNLTLEIEQGGFLLVRLHKVFVSSGWVLC